MTMGASKYSRPERCQVLSVAQKYSGFFVLSFRSPLEINAPSKVTSSPRINRVEILPREMKKREDHTVKNYNSAQFSSLSWTWNAAAASLPSPFLRSLVRLPQGKGEGPSTKIGYLSFIEFPFEVFVKGDSHCDRSSRKVMGYLLRQSKRVNLPIQVKTAAQSECDIFTYTLHLSTFMTKVLIII